MRKTQPKLSGIQKNIFACFFSPAIAGAIIAPVHSVFHMCTYNAEYCFSAENMNVLSIAFIIALGAVLGTAFGIPFVVVFGLPVHYLAMKIKFTRLWFYVLWGAPTGALAAALLYSYFGNPERTIPFSDVAFGAVTGMLAAAFFWLIRRPDEILAEGSET